MFDKYIIVADTLRNVGPADAPTGFAFQTKLGYYRGLGLSMVEELTVTVDGQAIPRDAIRFDEGAGALTLDDMAEAYDRRWPFGTAAEIIVDHPGGLAPGDHEITLQQKLRVSYMPFPSFNNDRKTMHVA
ncbi:DUF6379 domain-containing protein [uncultured Sphingomonas sp.]|uniref:C-glycoside deglycosidase beta subunit domain-containing protein n=1 Tax=uncultured Sphingomonas sp. TaxID=158754 RepID=UPI0025ED2001|nr:DUF6379 domain-containing protein [uncultured Sphingomonas sp.]